MFVKGQKVELVNLPVRLAQEGYSNGQTGTISKVSGSKFTFKPDRHRKSIIVFSRNLRALSESEEKKEDSKPEPKFKVGDKVRVIKHRMGYYDNYCWTYDSMAKYFGVEAKVISVGFSDSNKICIYRVQHHDGGWFNYSENVLELFEPPKEKESETPHEFKCGDIVEILEGENKGKVGFIYNVWHDIKQARVQIGKGNDEYRRYEQSDLKFIKNFFDEPKEHKGPKQIVLSINIEEK